MMWVPCDIAVKTGSGMRESFINISKKMGAPDKSEISSPTLAHTQQIKKMDVHSAGPASSMEWAA